MSTFDKYYKAEGWMLDGRIFDEHHRASSYLVEQGFAANEAHDYLMLLQGEAK